MMVFLYPDSVLTLTDFPPIHFDNDFDVSAERFYLPKTKYPTCTKCIKRRHPMNLYDKT